jgi:hypothetical protein
VDHHCGFWDDLSTFLSYGCGIVDAAGKALNREGRKDSREGREERLAGSSRFSRVFTSRALRLEAFAFQISSLALWTGTGLYQLPDRRDDHE